MTNESSPFLMTIGIKNNCCGYSFFNHRRFLVHGFVEFLDGKLGSGVEAFHFLRLLWVSKFADVCQALRNLDS